MRKGISEKVYFLRRCIWPTHRRHFDFEQPHRSKISSALKSSSSRLPPLIPPCTLHSGGNLSATQVYLWPWTLPLDLKIDPQLPKILEAFSLSDISHCCHILQISCSLQVAVFPDFQIVACKRCRWQIGDL